MEKAAVAKGSTWSSLHMGNRGGKGGDSLVHAEPVTEWISPRVGTQTETVLVV